MYIKAKNLPPKLPLLHFLVAYMWFDMYDTAGWIQGIVYFILAFATFGFFCRVVQETAIDLKDLVRRLW